METDRHGYCEHNRRDHKCWECHAQRARAAEIRVAELEEAISKLLFSPIGDIRTVAVRVDYAREAHLLIGGKDIP